MLTCRIGLYIVQWSNFCQMPFYTAVDSHLTTDPRQLYNILKSYKLVLSTFLCSIVKCYKWAYSTLIWRLQFDDNIVYSKCTVEDSRE